MRAVVIVRPGGPEGLELRDDIAQPEPGPSHIRVRVAASAVNRADLSQVAGRYPAPPGAPQDIPGLEYAGTVDATGPGASRWSVGDRVMGIVGGGGYAESVVVHEDEAIAVPERLTLIEAAAIPEVFLTAHDAMLTQMALHSGETLLVHGVGSGVGTAAVQIARAIGVTVIGTSRTAGKLERALALGLHVGIDTTAQSFEDVVTAETRGRGVDGILDLVGGAALSSNVRVLASHGRLIIVGVVAGARAELNMRALMSRRATIRGTVMRARPLDEKIEVARAFADFALPLLDTARLAPVIDRVLPMADVRHAHEAIARNETFGKIVLRWE